MARKRSVGKPRHNDTKALEGVRRIRRAKPRLSYRAAALEYALKHPEKEVQPASTARRLADKLRVQDGLPPQPRATRKKLLQDLRNVMVKALSIVDALAGMEQEPPEE